MLIRGPEFEELRDQALEWQSKNRKNDTEMPSLLLMSRSGWLKLKNHETESVQQGTAQRIRDLTERPATASPSSDDDWEAYARQLGLRYPITTYLRAYGNPESESIFRYDGKNVTVAELREMVRKLVVIHEPCAELAVEDGLIIALEEVHDLLFKKLEDVAANIKKVGAEIDQLYAEHMGEASDPAPEAADEPPPAEPPEPPPPNDPPSGTRGPDDNLKPDGRDAELF